jgi:hypothetical protein
MPGNWGGRRRGAGAKKGVSPRRKKLQELVLDIGIGAELSEAEQAAATEQLTPYLAIKAEAEEAGPRRRLSPLQYLVGVYNDPAESPQRRMAAAEAALPFLHCRLAPLIVSTPTRVDEHGVPILDVSSPNSSSTPSITSITILPMAPGQYVNDGASLSSTEPAPTAAPASEVDDTAA